jgi:cytochrome P450
MTATKIIPESADALANLRAVARDGLLRHLERLWQQHGDLFSVNLGLRRLTVAIHPDAVRHVSITHRQNYDKRESYDLVRRLLLGDGLVTSTGELWRQQRKLMAPFYTPRAVQAYADLMLREGQRLAQRWEQLARSDQPVDVPREMATITAAVILRAMFSTEADEDLLTIKDDVETMISFVAGQQTLPFQPPLWLPTARNRRYLAARQRTHAYIRQLIAQRRRLPEGAWPDDLLTRLMQARDEETGHRMSEDLLRDESITTFFAGHETTARTLTFVWYALAANPQVAERLHAELDRLPADRPLTTDDLHQLPYTLQVIKETLRLYPPAPIYVRDAIADDSIDGCLIPAGTSLILSPYFTHRHPDFWDDPLTFNPDRWTPEAEAARHPQAYHPFASGQRICIGSSFSLLESHLLLALLARRFSLRLPSGYAPQWVMQGTLNLANGLPMYVDVRASAATQTA